MLCSQKCHGVLVAWPLIIAGKRMPWEFLRMVDASISVEVVRPFLT